ncbi:hypothetical protein GOODEAATRI_002409 [Goodea atripinnis]|uniref:Uncharacterized protein n=1 Tax=Goodea atripinnis TaxID=208336 RepID=A0ABV0NGX6_9TELE
MNDLHHVCDDLTAADPERLTVSREDTAAHAAFMAPLQRRPTLRAELPPLQVPQFDALVCRHRRHPLALRVKAALRDGGAVMVCRRKEEHLMNASWSHGES